MPARMAIRMRFRMTLRCLQDDTQCIIAKTYYCSEYIIAQSITAHINFCYKDPDTSIVQYTLLLQKYNYDSVTVNNPKEHEHRGCITEFNTLLLNKNYCLAYYCSHHMAAKITKLYLAFTTIHYCLFYLTAHTTLLLPKFNCLYTILHKIQYCLSYLTSHITLLLPKHHFFTILLLEIEYCLTYLSAHTTLLHP